jgi:hypothetical protein
MENYQGVMQENIRQIPKKELPKTLRKDVE